MNLPEGPIYKKEILFCPDCGAKHIDKPDISIGWTNPPHKTHLCLFCGITWKPFPYCTMGVENLNDNVEVIQ